MLRTITICEKNLVCFPAGAIAVKDSVSTSAIPDFRSLSTFPHEIVSLTLQNTGNNVAYVNFGGDADNQVAYHKMIGAGQEVAIPGVVAVNVFAVGGTTIVPCIWYRSGL